MLAGGERVVSGLTEVEEEEEDDVVWVLVVEEGSSVVVVEEVEEEEEVVVVVGCSVVVEVVDIEIDSKMNGVVGCCQRNVAGNRVRGTCWR